MPEKITDERLRIIAGHEIRRATGDNSSELTEQRRVAYRYYYAQPFGNEIAGRSRVVSSDVQNVIESMMPDLMEIFAVGEETVRFLPFGVEDEEIAEQATDVANYVWDNDNDGYGITHDWLKDGLLQKNGFVKIWWDDSEHKTRHTQTDLNILSLQQLMADDDIEIIEYETHPAAEDQMQFAPDGALHDVTFTRIEQGRIRIENVPPDEMLVENRAVDLDESGFLCHRVEKTISDLVEMGFDWDTISSLPRSDDSLSEERVARFETEGEWPEEDYRHDQAMQKVTVYETYIRADGNGDGVAEWRQLYLAGSGYTLLQPSEEVDDHPFSEWTPIRMPHKLWGRSEADLTMDIQKIKSTIWRQWLDNLYQINNNRAIVNQNINIDDAISNRVSGLIRSKGTQPVGNNYAPVPIQSIGPVALQGLEYCDTSLETRTGETRYSQGVDADSLNKTAYGIGQILGRSQKRKMLIARNFAELGMKRAFRKILRLLINHQDKPRTLRLRGEQVTYDPSTWNADMDAQVVVGLGHGTKEQEQAGMGAVAQVLAQMVQAQQGVNGPVVYWDNIYEASKKTIEVAGFRNAEKYVRDPSRPPQEGQIQPQQQQQPSPEAILAQIEQGKMQLESQKMQLTGQIEAEKAKQAREKMNLEHEREIQKIMLEDDRARMKLSVDTALSEAELRQSAEDASTRAALHARKDVSDAQLKERGLNMKATQAQRSDERPN